MNKIAFRTNCVLFFAFLFSFGSLRAQEVTFYENPALQGAFRQGGGVYFPLSSKQPKINLNGSWQVIFQNGKSESVSVPSSVHGKEILKFQREFDLPRWAEGKEISLVSEGISNQCEIFINDQFIRLHVGSGSPFQLVIPAEYLRFGEKNLISITVDPNLYIDGSSIPTRAEAYDYKNFTGIFRDIYFTIKPEIHFEETKIITESLARAADSSISALISVSTKIKSLPLQKTSLDNDSLRNAKCVLSLSVFQNDTLTIVRYPKLMTFQLAGDRIFAESFSLTVPSVKPWRPESPNLYRVIFELRTEAGLLLDEAVVSFGFRKIEVNNGRFCLNSEPFQLKGVTVAELDETAGISLSRQMILRDAQSVKTLGANAVRFRRIPGPEWLSLCDSLGIFVLLDFPVDRVPSPILSTKRFLENAVAYQRQIIAATQLHPSIFAYGFGSGLDLSDPKSAVYLDFLKTAFSQQTRGLCFFTPKEFVPGDDFYRKVDFLGLGIFEGTLSEFEEKLRKARATLPEPIPLVITEYGTLTEPDNHNGYSDTRSLEYQAKYVLDRYKVIAAKSLTETDAPPPLAGSFFQTLYDYPVEIELLSTAEHSNPSLLTMGLLTSAREKKDAFQTVKLLYASERVYNPPIGSAEEDFSPSLIITSIVLTLILIYLLNSNKRIRENLPRSLTRPFSLYMDIRDMRIYNFDPIVLNAILGMIWSSNLIAILYSARLSPITEFWLGHIFGNGTLKTIVNAFILNPILGVVVLGLCLYLFTFLIVYLILFIFWVMGKTRVKFVQISNLLTWSCGPWFTLVFASAFIDRLESKFFIFTVLAISAVFFILSWIRIFKGLSVITEISKTKIYIVGLLLLAFVIGIPAYTFNNNRQTTVYFKYWQKEKP
ncbi:MAG: glycoside hydrolase family 2 TIM barrel-domain containing protein [Chloroherpetonaceae bacterium]|nr:glycoside hydrolase family 2 TIM barrel-domain containing protein [Chloroherpetonaceae bacterium]